MAQTCQGTSLSSISTNWARVTCLDMAGGRRRAEGAKATGFRVTFTDEYFVFPHMFWMIAIPFGFCLLFVSIHTPHLHA